MGLGGLEWETERKTVQKGHVRSLEGKIVEWIEYQKCRAYIGAGEMGNGKC